MPVKAGQIVIDVDAGTAKMVVDLEKAKGKFREFGSAGVGETKAVSGALREMEGHFGNNIRAADAFVAKTLGLGPVLQAAFPIVGGLAFAGIIEETGKKVYEFFQNMSEGPKKVSEAFRSLNDSLRLTNDELQVSNVRLENDIAKLEGKRENTLALALAEARLAADKLADSLEKDLAAIDQVLQKQSVGFLDRIYGIAGTGGVEDEYKKFRADIEGRTQSGQTAIRAAADRGDNGAVKTEQDKLNADLISRYRAFVKTLDDQIKAAEQAQYRFEHYRQGPSDARENFLNPPADQSSALAALRGLRGQISERQDWLGFQSANNALSGQKPAAEKIHEYQDAVKQLQTELVNAQNAELSGLEKIDAGRQQEIDKLREEGHLTKETQTLVDQVYNTKWINEYNTEIASTNKMLAEQSERWKRLQTEAAKAIDRMHSEEIKEQARQLEELSKSLEKAAKEYNRAASEAAKAQSGHAMRMIGIQNSSADPLKVLALQQDIERNEIEARYQEQLKIDNTLLGRATALKQKQFELDKLDYEMEEAQAAQRQRGVKDFFLEMETNSKSAGHILYDSLNSALDRVSDQFAKLFTGQKTSFSKMFQGLGEEMIKESTKSMMQKGLGSLGKLFGIHVPTGKPDGSAGNPLHVVMDGATGSIPGAGGGPGSSGFIGSTVKDASGLSSFFSSLFGGGGGGAASSVDSIIQLAEGGDVDPGRPYVVGDGGEPELFTPRTPGTITPAHKIGGGEYHYHIDARGAALGVENRIARGIAAAHDSAIANSVRASAERAKRTPKRS